MTEFLKDSCFNLIVALEDVLFNNSKKELNETFSEKDYNAMLEVYHNKKINEIIDTLDNEYHLNKRKSQS